MSNTRNFTAMSTGSNSAGGGVDEAAYRLASCDVDSSNGRMVFCKGDGPYGFNFLQIDPSSKRPEGVNEETALQEGNKKIELAVGKRRGDTLYCCSPTDPEEIHVGLGFRNHLVLPGPNSLLLRPQTTAGFGLFPQGLGLSVPPYVVPSGMIKEINEMNGASDSLHCLRVSDRTKVLKMDMFGGVDALIVPVVVDGRPIGKRTFVDFKAMDQVVGNMMKKSKRDEDKERQYKFSEITGAFLDLLETQSEAIQKKPHQAARTYTFLHQKLPATFRDTLDLVVSNDAVSTKALENLHKKLYTLRVPLLLSVFWSERSKKWFYIETISVLIHTDMEFLKVTQDVSQDEYHDMMKYFAELHGKNAAMEADLKVLTISYENEHLKAPIVIEGRDLHMQTMQQLIHDNFEDGTLSMEYKVKFTHDDETPMLACEGPYIPVYQIDKKRREPGSVLFVIEKDCGTFSQGKIVVILYMFTLTNYLVMTSFDIDHELFQMQRDKQSQTWRLIPLEGGVSQDAKSGIQTPTIEPRDIFITGHQILAHAGIDAKEKQTMFNDLLLAFRQAFFVPAHAQSKVTVRDLLRDKLTDEIKKNADHVAEMLTMPDLRTTLPEMFKPVANISELDPDALRHLQLTPTGLFLKGLMAFGGSTPIGVEKLHRQGKVYNGKATTETSLKLNAPDTHTMYFEGKRKAYLVPVGSDFLGVPTPLTIRGGDSDIKHARDDRWRADKKEKAVLRSLLSNTPASELPGGDEEESGDEDKSSEESKHDSDESFEVSDNDSIPEESAEEEDLGMASDEESDHQMGCDDEENGEGGEGGGNASNGAEPSAGEKRKRDAKAKATAADKAALAYNAARANAEFKKGLARLRKLTKVAARGGRPVTAIEIKTILPDVKWRD